MGRATLIFSYKFLFIFFSTKMIHFEGRNAEAKILIQKFGYN